MTYSKLSASDQLSDTINVAKTHIETVFTWSHVYVEYPLDISLWDRLCKKVTKRTHTLLSDISGVARPGEILAVMGTSGVGKTTLLNYLSGQNDPRLTKGRGDVCLNGYLLNRKQRQNGSYIGHVQQHEPFLSLMSLEEHLIFQAMLRMPKLPNDAARRQAVDEMIKLLSLEKCRDTLIDCLSGGEKKRLAFATVLLSDPRVVLIDEPTSGLDLYLAKRLMNLIATMAVEQRRTLIIVLHQPTSEMFAHINTLCLIVHGGRQAYFGARENAADFFSSQCKIPGNSLEHYIEQLAAPAESGEEAFHKGKIAADCFENSVNAQEMHKEINTLAGQPIGTCPAEKKSESNVGICRQIKWLLWRIWIDLRRNPKRTIYLAIRIILMAALYGALLFQINPHDEGYVQNINSLMFLMVIALLDSNMAIIIIGMISERPVIIHDYKRGMYSIPAYYLTRLFADVIYAIVTSVVYTGLTAGLVGFRKPFQSIVVSTLNLIAGISASALMAASTSSIKMALIFLQPIFLTIAQFSGFYMNTSTIPVYIRWFQYISFFYYYYQLMLVFQWRNDGCAQYTVPSKRLNSTETHPVCRYRGDDVLEYYDANPHHAGFDIGMLVVIIVVVQALAFSVTFIRLRRCS